MNVKEILTVCLILSFTFGFCFGFLIGEESQLKYTHNLLKDTANKYQLINIDNTIYKIEPYNLTNVNYTNLFLNVSDQK